MLLEDGAIEAKRESATAPLSRLEFPTQT